MIKKLPKIIWLLFVVSFIKEIIFAAIVPVWHAPDEQAHFAQVAIYAEKINPTKGKDLNREIYESEKILGTLRDDQGNNKFTYHPEYKIEYTESFEGKYENEIKKLPEAFRKELIKNEAANYPPLYYLLGGTVYKVFYGDDLISRVYDVRIFSILFGVGIVGISYLLAKELFPKKPLLQIALPTLVSFQPMLSFVSAGVTSDTLTNFLFTWEIYLSVLVITRSDTKKYIALSLLIIFLLYLTKPQFILAIPMLVSAIAIKILSKAVNKKKITSLILLGGLLVGLITIILTQPVVISYLQLLYPQSFSPGDLSKLANPIEFLKMSLNRLAHETIPWYFGVYDWLGVVLPIEILRVINRLLIIIGLGVLWKIILIIKKRETEDFVFIQLLLVSLIYLTGIIFYDYLFYSSHNFSFGLQGRYFFPTIVAHTAILLVGFRTLFSFKFQRYKDTATKFLMLLMVALNCFTVWLIAKTYYDLSDLNNFIVQVSQYKPDFFKGNQVTIILIIYTVFLVIFLFKLFLLNEKKKLK